MNTCIANASNDPNAVIACTRPASCTVFEQRSLKAARILGRDTTEHLMCLEHAVEVCAADPSRFSWVELKDA